METLLKCSKCRAEVTINLSYCPNCGTHIYLLDEAKSPEEVTRDWLTKILELIEYKSHLSIDGKNTIISCHEIRGDLNLYLKKEIGLIIVTTTFSMNMKRRNCDLIMSLYQKLGLFKEYMTLNQSLNEANKMVYRCKFFLSGDTKTLICYSFIQLIDSITGRDIIVLLEQFNKDIWYALRWSGIYYFCKANSRLVANLPFTEPERLRHIVLERL